MLLLYQRAPSDTKFLGFHATARSSPRFCFPTRRRAGCRAGCRFAQLRSHMKVKMLGNTPSLSYVSCWTGRVVLPIPGRVGVRRERGRPFPFTTNVLARALQWIQSSRIILVHMLEI